MRVVWSCLVNLGNDARTLGSNQLLSSADSSPLPCQIGGDNRATAHQSGLAQCCPPPGLEPRTCISRARCTANWVCVALRAFPICPKRVPGLIGVALRTPSLQGFGGFAPPSTRASSRLVTSQPLEREVRRRARWNAGRPEVGVCPGLCWTYRTRQDPPALVPLREGRG